MTPRLSREKTAKRSGRRAKRRSPAAAAEQRSGLILLGITALTLTLWTTPAVWPLKILVVFFHELGHAAATIATGGQVLGITMSLDQAGSTSSRGGLPVVILNAGYLSSIVTGTALLWLSRDPKWPRKAAAILTVVMLFSAVLWVRPMLGFGFIFAMAAVAVVGLSTRFATDLMVQLGVRTIGLFSVLYGLIDACTDVLSEGVVSDASLLEQVTYIDAWIWGAGWIALSLGLLWSSRRWWV